MNRTFVSGLIAGSALVLAGAACAGSSSDYTPQIAVVPGAAARSLWIASKRPQAQAADDGGEIESDDAVEAVDAGDDAP